MYLLYDLMSVLLLVKYVRYVRIIDHSTLNALRFVANDLLYLQYFHMVKSLLYNTAYSIFTMTCLYRKRMREVILKKTKQHRYIVNVRNCVLLVY